MARPEGRAADTLRSALERRTREAAATLTEKLPGGKVRCLACGHRCLILPGRDGICRVRFNRDGTLRVPRGYVAGLQVDPIEKKPFFHALPGTGAVSFGMLGCDFHCSFCQNWLSSQALRDPSALAGISDIEPEEIVDLALRTGSPAVVSTYNEPLITTEWAVEVFSLARKEGLVCGYVSNGNATPEVLRYLRPYTDLYKVDLKCFRDRSYRTLGGTLDHVVATIRLLHEMGFWVEVVTLLVPGFNDSEAELRDLTSFIASVSSDIPWHVTAFHPDFKMTEGRATTVSDLARAAAIGRQVGLRFVYAGNLPGMVGDLENTRCPSCGRTVIERRGNRVLTITLTPEGSCPACGKAIAGYWRPRAKGSVPTPPTEGGNGSGGTARAGERGA